MKRYTVDASALIYFCVGQLPGPAHEAFSKAASGKIALELPVIAAVEAMFVLDRRESVQNVQVPMDGEEALRVFESLPVSFVESSHADASGLLDHMDLFPTQMHDAMIVANHENRETDAIITSDAKMAERFPTVWG